MKILKRLFMSALAFVFALGLSAAFAACGTDESDTETSETDRIVGNWFCKQNYSGRWDKDGNGYGNRSYDYMLVTIEYDRFSFTEYRLKYYRRSFGVGNTYKDNWELPTQTADTVYTLEKRTKFDFVLNINSEVKNGSTGEYISFITQRNVQLNVKNGEDPYICLCIGSVESDLAHALGTYHYIPFDKVCKFIKTALTIEEFSQMELSEFNLDTHLSYQGEFDTDRLQVEEGSYKDE